MDLRVLWPLFAGLSLFLAGCERPLNTATSPSNFEAFVVNDPRIEESSGLATASSGDAFYTINDSGNEPEVYTLNRAGKVVSVTKVAGVRNIDWEDLGFQVIAGQPYLHIADVGDNSERRESIYIHRIPEKLKARTVQPITYQLRYPDGPHNCEAFFVDSTGGFTLITKSSKRTMIFYLAVPRPGCVNELVSVGSINLDAPSMNARLVTGASISPAGSMSSSELTWRLTSLIGRTKVSSGGNQCLERWYCLRNSREKPSLTCPPETASPRPQNFVLSRSRSLICGRLQTPK